MNILYDHQIFGTQIYGGITRYYIELANRVSAKGNNVQIRSPLYVTRYPFGCIKPKGIHIPFIPTTLPRMRALNSMLTSALWPATTGIDVYHETYYAKTGYCPPNAARVITVHDMIHEKFPHFFHPDDKTSDNKRIASFRADHIICVSQNTKNDLVDCFNIRPDKISVIYHGITQHSVDVKHNPTYTRPFLLYVGARHRYKNFERFVKAFAQSHLLTDEFDIVCFGGEPLSKTEKKIITENDLINNIHFSTGSDSCLAALYSHAFALIYPSLYEGFGLPALEAMAYGCPVICSHTSSIPEVAGDAATYFDPYIVESIQYAIESVVRSSHTRERMILNGLKQSQLFSWDRCAADTIDVYNTIVS